MLGNTLKQQKLDAILVIPASKDGESVQFTCIIDFISNINHLCRSSFDSKDLNNLAAHVTGFSLMSYDYSIQGRLFLSWSL